MTDEAVKTRQAILADRVSFMMQFKPFDYPFEGRTAMRMHRLLFGIGYHSLCGYSDISVRHACLTYADVHHPNTVQKMIKIAQETGYIEVYKNPEKDARRLFIRPTALLQTEFESALDRLLKNTVEFWNKLEMVEPT